MHIRMSLVCLGGFSVRGPVAAGRPSSTTLSQTVPVKVIKDAAGRYATTSATGSGRVSSDSHEQGRDRIVMRKLPHGQRIARFSTPGGSTYG
jgi:hypothetical protein